MFPYHPGGCEHAAPTPGFDDRGRRIEDVEPMLNRSNDLESGVPHIAAPVALRFEHRTDDGPVLGIGTALPRLSWVVPEADAAFAQDAYEVEVRGDGRDPAVARVASAEQVLVPWPAAPLASREAAGVRVRVGSGGAWSAWSEPATVEAGLLGADAWTARFVSPSELGRIGAPAPVLGASLRVAGPVVRARLYA